jgi:hypothetical protein
VADPGGCRWTSLRWSERTQEKCADEGKCGACSKQVQLQGKIHGRASLLVTDGKNLARPPGIAKRASMLHCRAGDKSIRRATRTTTDFLVRPHNEPIRVFENSKKKSRLDLDMLGATLDMHSARGR